MAHVTVIGASSEQVEYRLSGAHGCRGVEVNAGQMGYHADDTERPLVWTGAGLAEVGIEAGSVLDEGQYDAARALMAGRDPRSGEQLVAPKLAVYEDAKLSLAPLVREVERVAQERGVEPGEVFTSAKDREAFERAQRSVERMGEGARLRADEAGSLADAAGLDVEKVWEPGACAAALGNLEEVGVVTTDGVSADVLAPRRRVVGNLGYDVSFTLPKSYSLLLAFAREQDAGAVEDVYAAQVGRTFDWLESQTAYGMRGKHGSGRSAETVSTSGFLGWSMVHRAARPVGDRVVGDPHWHVHVTIANMARGEDGQWSTVAAGGRDLMRHAPAADHVLKALVRHQLGERFGVDFARSERTGTWEVSAIPDETLRAFSKRGASIEAMLRDLGFDRAEASRRTEDLAAAQTRQAKKHTTAATDEDLRAVWQEEARDLGGDPGAIAAAAMAPREEGQREPATEEEQAQAMAGIVARLLDPEKGLTSDRRRFSRVEALAAVADAMHTGAADVQQIERVTDAALEDAGFVSLAGPGAQQVACLGGASHQLGSGHMSNAARWTTADVVAAERVVLGAARRSTEGQGAAAVSASTAAMARSAVEASQDFPLSGEQAQIMHGLVTSDRAVDAVLGPPGTGKTTLMRAARAAWEAEGYVVVGAATAAVAAANLAAESGIASRTVAQWVERIEHGSGLAGIDVMVLDEANLTDDRDRAKLYLAAQESGTKVVEIGDPKQLRGVGCGSLFGRVHSEVGGGELSFNRRQRDEDERGAISAWRQGDYAGALESWSDRGRLVATETGTEALTAMVARWMVERAGAPDAHAEMRGVVMLAASNESVERLNDAAQAVRVASGELGQGRTYKVRAGREVVLREGDHVLIRLNDRQQRMHVGPDVLNGYRGVVEGIDERGAVAVSWREVGPDGEREQRATLSPAYVAAGGLSLGYAMTGHKAEGMTVSADWTRPDGIHQGGSVLVHGPGMDEPGMHVATSRHRDRVHIFAGRDQLEDSATTHDLGMPRSADERQARVVQALATHARTHSSSGNDRPVLDDLSPGRRPAAQPRPEGRVLSAEERWRSLRQGVPEPAAPSAGGQPQPQAQPRSEGGQDERGRRAKVWAALRGSPARPASAREQQPSIVQGAEDAGERARAEQERRRADRQRPERGRGPRL